MTTRNIPRSFVFILILGMGFFWRLWGLWDIPVWFDEAWGVSVCSGDIHELYGYLKNIESAHPPAYLGFLFFLERIAGNNASAARFASMLFGIASIWLTLLLGEKLGGLRLGVMAGALMALSPFHIWYCQRARNYSLEVLCVTASTYYILKIVSAGEKNRASGFWPMTVYFCWLCGAVYTDYFGWLIVGTHCIWLLYMWNRRAVVRIRRWAVVYGLVVIAYLPWIQVMWRVLNRAPLASSQFLPSKKFWMDLFYTVVPFARLAGRHAGYAGALMAFVVGLVLVRLVISKRPQQYTLLLCSLIVPIACVPFLPMVSVRSMIILLPFVCITLGLVALEAFQKPAWRYMLCLLVLLLQILGGVGFNTWYNEQATNGRALEPWHKVAETLKGCEAQTERILMYAQYVEEPTMGLPLRYYLPERTYTDIIYLDQVRRYVQERGASVLVVRKRLIDQPERFDSALASVCENESIMQLKDLGVYLCRKAVGKVLKDGIVFEERALLSPGTFNDEYLQDVIIVKREEGFAVWSRVYGRSLGPKDNDAVLSPYVRIVDDKGTEIVRLNVHNGWMGYNRQKWGQAEKQIEFSSLPERFSVYIGYVYYIDDTHQPGGGPAEIRIK